MLPNDPLGRRWLDLSGANPSLVSQFRPVMVSFLGFDLNKNPKLMGTGFIIAGNEAFYVVVTARHVIDGLQLFQRPLRHAPSAVPGLFIQPKVSLDPRHLKVLRTDQGSARLMNVAYVTYAENLDVALCLITPQESEEGLVPYAVPLDCGTPSVGDIVHLVSCGGMDVSETSPPLEPDGKGQALRIERSVCIRMGTVTAVHKHGYNQYRFPCFSTSIPAEHGMSGGFVYKPRDGKMVAACGIVSADLDLTHRPRVDFSSKEESVISCAWPLLGFNLPVSILPDGTTSNALILDLVKAGDMPTYEDSADFFEIADAEDHGLRLRCKS
ncbi:hypothetical protein GH983_06900 [Agrobacterium sp. MA01]|uniref:trypsin-like peptidase domain-containing protein n=1 Tax=Agrobacterium sp. MA01 TaxID=2664893 RepID=UPI00129B09BE|nr:trypsin-like peptidase domain-containing protein [Agrobacterium sp. MA01]QGG90211.1 hypothetical protein GH983_06900 [Agrobacterium sp. MA01]